MRVSVVFEPYPTPALIYDWLLKDYGLDTSVFDGYRLWHRPGVHAIWLASEHAGRHVDTPLETLGIQVTRRPPPRAKPSTYFAQKFGRYAQRNVVDLEPEQMDAFFRGELIDVDSDEKPGRYCIVRYKGQALGCGWLNQGQVRSNLPRYWEQELPDGRPIGC